MRLIPFDDRTAEYHAEIRSTANVKRADAIQLASVASGGANVFVTNDDRLSRTKVAGIDFIIDLDVKLW